MQTAKSRNIIPWIYFLIIAPLSIWLIWPLIDNHRLPFQPICFALFFVFVAIIRGVVGKKHDDLIIYISLFVLLIVVLILRQLYL